MTEGQLTEQRPSASVAEIVRDHFGLSLDDVTEGRAGEESVGWRVPTADGDRFVQCFPKWRRVEELEWCDKVATAAASAAPVCVHAVQANDGVRAVETSDGPVMVFPFVDGGHPDDDKTIADEAAELLARIHGGIARSWTAHADSAPTRAPSPTGALDPRLVDETLDAWEQEVAFGTTPLLPIHGDYYAGNLLVADDRIVGVIDWSEARLEHQQQELSWAVWEFAQNGFGDDLAEDAAIRFLRGYADAEGPAEISPPFDAVPWIRQRLRLEASQWHEPTSTSASSTYHEAQVRAFSALRGRSLSG